VDADVSTCFNIAAHIYFNFHLLQGENEIKLIGPEPILEDRKRNFGNRFGEQGLEKWCKKKDYFKSTMTLHSTQFADYSDKHPMVKNVDNRIVDQRLVQHSCPPNSWLHDCVSWQARNKIHFPNLS
jgi:hypothetical protein